MNRWRGMLVLLLLVVAIAAIAGWPWGAIAAGPNGERGGPLTGDRPVSTSPTMAGGDFKIGRIISQLGGASYAAAARDDLAVIGEGASLVVLSLSDPAAPVEIGRTLPLPDFVEDIALVGDIVYVAAGDGGLRVFSIADPAAPVEIHRLATPGSAVDLAVSGSYLFIAATGGLHVVDITASGSPTTAAVMPSPADCAAVAVAGATAYVVAGNGLHILDVADPVAPVETGAYLWPAGLWTIRDVAVAGDTAYVAGGWDGLFIFDVADPAAPALTTSFELNREFMGGVEVDGNLAYLSDFWWVGDSLYHGLRIVSLADPAAPVTIGVFDTSPNRVEDVVAGGDAVYLADGEGGLRVLSLADPTAPSQVGFYDTAPGAVAMALQDDYLYLTGPEGDLHVVNVADPARPVLAGRHATPGFAHNLVVDGGYAYVADGEAGLRILSLAEPAAPVETGFFDTAGEAMDVAVAGDYAYVADYLGGLGAYNVANPAAPAPAGSLYADGSTETRNVIVDGEYAYTGIISHPGPKPYNLIYQFCIAAITDPATLEPRGCLETPEQVEDMAVTAAYAYILNNGFMTIANIADPVYPYEIEPYLTILGVPLDVDLAGDEATIAGFYHVVIYDIANPVAPVFSGIGDTPDGAANIVVAGDTVYVANRDSGLIVLQFAPAGYFSYLPVSATPGLD